MMELTELFTAIKGAAGGTLGLGGRQALKSLQDIAN